MSSRVVQETAHELELRHGAGFVRPRDITFVRGEGAHLFDDEGHEYIDTAAAHGAASLGHAHPVLIAAIERQARRLMLSTPSFANDERAAYLSELCAVLPDGMQRVFLCNSGTEAIEAGLKVARLATKREGVVSCVRGFHGRTLGALSATWEPKYRSAFSPWLQDVQHVPLGRVDALEEAVDDNTCAIVIEVVQGEGGVRPASAEFLAAAQRLAHERGALLLVDEVQTGFARTGRMFAVEHTALRADLIALSKGIAGGFPMGALAIGARVPELPLGAHGSTFGGNPLACAAARATLSVLKDEQLASRANELGDAFRERLGRIDDPRIREIRGLGLMIGVELRVPAAPIVRGLLDRRIVALSAGRNVLRFLPPLVIEADDLERVADALEEVLRCA
ncbi:MAG: acetylornithine/LysW-gamma-L-lysine aminotransferase [Planctomycetota bacterium]|jgi:acetylornithine/LysW-gamma-L-lysine aminotransferase